MTLARVTLEGVSLRPVEQGVVDSFAVALERADRWDAHCRELEDEAARAARVLQGATTAQRRAHLELSAVREAVRALGMDPDGIERLIRESLLEGIDLG